MLVTAIILISIIIIILLISFICFHTAFYVPRKMTLDPRHLLEGEQYEVFADETLKMIDDALKIEYDEVYIRSCDGLNLFGRYYETSPDAPLQIMIHGYQSMALRDFCGGLQFALGSGFNVLLVDQRAHGKSEGKYLTFGIREKEDCVEWIKYAVNRFGKDKKIILMGVSMGAATVLMASDMDLPSNVRGIVADSGYTSPAEIIRKVIRDRRFPVKITYFFMKLGAKLFGHLDLDDGAVKSVSNTKIPVLFFHGEDDRFVPCDMCRRLFDACASEKEMITVPKAGHALGFMVDRKKYKETFSRFTDKVLQKSF